MALTRPPSHRKVARTEVKYVGVADPINRMLGPLAGKRCGNPYPLRIIRSDPDQRIGPA
jgi:hypothetical protein